MPGEKRIRKNILDLTTEEKDKLITAWKGIQEKEADDENGFFALAGFHGQPFRGPGYGNASWWGGYCHHGNVLFPTWHRAYILRLEDALRTIQGCEDVTLPYWDEMKGEHDGQKERIIPKIFTDRKYTLNGEEINNPLYSYRLVQGFKDRLSRPGVDYGKPKGYETVRYPFSGLVGSNDERKTNVHNQWMKRFTDEQTTGYLNENLRNWFEDRDNGQNGIALGLRSKYRLSLAAPNYTVFSNTTSAGEWSDVKEKFVVSVESPHNGGHLAIGGYDMPDRPSFDGANGDMGENDTAAFDPVFWFHHCFIDRVFWRWQEIHSDLEKTGVDGVQVIPEYPGTSPVDSQGPTPGMAAHEWLTIDTPLYPFNGPGSSNDASGSQGSSFWTSRSISNLEALPYQYDNSDIIPKDDPLYASISAQASGGGKGPKGPNPPQLKQPAHEPPYLRISGIDRASIKGSFIISAWAKDGNKPETFLGCEPVFSRWNVTGCANCNNHLKVTAYIPLSGFKKGFLGRVGFGSKIGTSHARSGVEIAGGEFTTALVVTGTDPSEDQDED
ncbi:hypothetical protein TWF730_002518 [Orbilia blumenaviensis]|uniref:tyrosinase n=1 Tax=Orbilia blumenaviensis TaxID=1796055 RepID=A0AAV9UA50_9PEZI